MTKILKTTIFVFLLGCLLITTNGLCETNRVLFLGNLNPEPYVNVPRSASLEPVSNLTVEAWIKPFQMPSGFLIYNIVSKRISEHGAPFNSYILGGNNTSSNWYGSVQTPSGPVYAPSSIDIGWNNWAHIAMSYDGLKTKFYINGNLVSSSNASGSLIYSLLSLRIGKAKIPQFDDGFYGLVDEVRVWNRTRTASEIQTTMTHELYGNEIGLVGYWNFNDGTANDLSSQHNHGSFIDGATTILEDVPFTPYSYPLSDYRTLGITNAISLVSDNSSGGGLSLKMGGIGLLADGQMAGIEGSATGPGILTFDWKVSSEADWDWLRFYETGSGSTNKISGNVDWNRVSITVTGAVDLAHTFRWEYEKDPIGDYVGEDCGWVDAITWSPLYTMTVNNGAGDGYYTNNAYASITADPAEVHYEFDRWTGDTNTVENIFSATTTIRMPNTHATVTATYKPILYTLSTASATGEGSYPYATTVEIRASAFENKRFYRWTGDVGSVADMNAATTTVVTSDQTISLTATYSVPLTVSSGSGSGWYPEGSPAIVSADADPMWKEFAAWTGDAGLLSNANARTTTLTLPTGPATVTATYRDSISRLAGSYGRTYSESGTAGAITPDDAAGTSSGTPAVKLGGAGVIPDNGFAAFETVVSGSGSILFQWKVSSESNGDYLKFKVDGSEIASISGTKGPWTQVSNRVDTAGSHTLRWEYVKNGSLSSSTDAGWVDDIVWIGDVAIPVITPDIISAIATNNQMALDFIGERGISYVLQTNATLNTGGWADWQQLPFAYSGETNGLHQFNIPPHMLGHEKMFYRIIGR